MSNDDQLDDQLRRMAERSMQRRAAAVDTDAALNDHRARLDRPRMSRGRDRRWLAAAASLLVVIAGVAAIAWPRSESEPDLLATETVATESVATSTPTTSDVSSTIDPPTETTTTSIPTATSGSASPETVRAGGTTSQLLAAAARHRVYVENSFGGGSPFDRVEVIDLLGTESDGFVRYAGATRKLSDDEKRAIVNALDPLDVEFVEAQSRVDESDELVGQLSLSEPVIFGTEAEITTGIVCGGTCGAGGTLRFSFAESEWQYVESIGGEWIS